MPLSFEIDDREWASATGNNVYSGGTTSQFDYPPTLMFDAVITARPDDDDPRQFDIGETYDISYSIAGFNITIEDAEVIRSDAAPDGGGVVVFEGVTNLGSVVHLVWTPGFDLEDWYWDNFTGGQPPGFYVFDTNAGYTHSFVCFAADTRLATPNGFFLAGDLQPGQPVTLWDGGSAQVAWTCKRSVRGLGRRAPVLFETGAIGNHAPLRVSQQHRVMIACPQAELLFGSSEVLVHARALVNGSTIRIVPQKEIEYVHFLLPRHEIVVAAGAPCESLLPGPETRRMLPPEDLQSLLPRIASRVWQPARPILKDRDARALDGPVTAPRKPERYVVL